MREQHLTRRRVLGALGTLAAGSVAADVSRAVARVTRDSCHARTQAGAAASGTPPSAQRSRMASVCLQGNLRLGQVHL